MKAKAIVATILLLASSSVALASGEPPSKKCGDGEFKLYLTATFNGAIPFGKVAWKVGGVHVGDRHRMTYCAPAKETTEVTATFNGILKKRTIGAVGDPSFSNRIAFDF